MNWNRINSYQQILVVPLESLIRFNDKCFSYGKQCIKMINFAIHAEKLLELHSNRLIAFWELLGKTSTEGAGEKSKVCFMTQWNGHMGLPLTAWFLQGQQATHSFYWISSEASSHISLWVHVFFVWALEKMQMTAKLLLSLQNGNCGWSLNLPRGQDK